MKRFLDANDPFFRPVWRRWATALLPLAWGAVELYNDSPGWALLFGAAGAYAFYMLIVAGPNPQDQTTGTPAKADPENNHPDAP